MRRVKKFQSLLVMELVSMNGYYGSPESLSLFMYQKPKSAKKLFFDVFQDC